MRICFISQEYPPETESGGIGTYTRMMARELHALGHEVHVICQTHKQAYDTSDDGVAVHRVPARITVPLMHRLCYPMAPATMNCLAWTWSARRRYDELAKSLKFHIVETSEFAAQGLAFRDIGAARLVTKLHTPMHVVHELNRTPETRDLRWAKWLERRATRASAAVTSCSTDLGRRISREWDIQSITTVHNPIDINQFHANGTVPSGPHVVYVGTLSLRKGVDTLVRAVPQVLKAIPDARFSFAGRDTASAPSGDSMQRWAEAELAETERAQVTFLGAVPHDEMRKVYGSASIVCVPSRWENFPYSALEPMACARGVIGTAVGGIPEIVQDGVTGRLVAPEDAEALADAIIETLADPALVARYGEASRRRVEEHFAGPVIARETAAFYQSLLAGARS